jgi:hypothetical protein
VNVPWPKHSPLHVAQLVENEQGMVAGAPEVAVEDGAFLLAEGWAVGAVHVEHQPPEPGALMNPVNPKAGEVSQCFQILFGGEHPSLETGHLARRGSKPQGVPVPNKCSHGGVKPETLRIIHIFIPSEPSKNRLPKKGNELMLDVFAQAILVELLSRHLTQIQSLIQLAEGEQSSVRGDGCAPELKL